MQGSKDHEMSEIYESKLAVKTHYHMRSFNRSFSLSRNKTINRKLSSGLSQEL